MRLDLIHKVLAMAELERACREAFGCSPEELRERAQIGQALAAWGEAVKWLASPDRCVSPSGRTDGHMTYVDLRDGTPVCAFCKRSS